MMKQIMARAWELARQGVTKFGGKVREYFAVSLSIAWKESKTVTIQLKGTEKQVKWAMDIINCIEAVKPQMKDALAQALEERSPKGRKEELLAECNVLIDKLIELPALKGEAGMYISVFGGIKTEKDALEVIPKVFEHNQALMEGLEISKFARVTMLRTYNKMMGCL